MEFIKKHKAALIVTLICLILLLLAFFAIYRMFYPSNSESVYGDRLENAPEIDNAVIEQIKNDINDTGLVTDVRYETNVATMKFFIDVKSDTKLEEVQKIGDMIINTLSTKVVAFYDIEIFLDDPSDANSSYPAIGYHSKNSSEFSWIDNIVEDGEEDEE